MSNLLENIAAGIIEGKLNEVPDLVQNALDEGLEPTKILENGLVVGMNEVGKRFKLGSMFVPEVLRSARTMHAGQELLRPLLADSGANLGGKIVLGTFIEIDDQPIKSVGSFEVYVQIYRDMRVTVPVHVVRPGEELKPVEDSVAADEAVVADDAVVADAAVVAGEESAVEVETEAAVADEVATE